MSETNMTPEEALAVIEALLPEVPEPSTDWTNIGLPGEGYEKWVRHGADYTEGEMRTYGEACARTAVAAMIARNDELDSTLNRVLIETANELGCAADNEAILQAIHDAKIREAEQENRIAELEAERDGLRAIPPPPDGWRYFEEGGRSEVFDVAAWDDEAGLWRDDETGMPVLHPHGDLKDFPTGHFNVVLVQVKAIDAARAEAGHG
jgi:hypothetical protein